MMKKLKTQDCLQRFLFENQSIRGVLVNLDASYKQALTYHKYKPAVARLLGQMLTAAALLASTLKFKGSLTLQAQGSKSLKLLLAQTNEKLQLRGLALASDKTPASFSKALGEGHLLIDIAPQEGSERYQAITAITGDSLADTLQHYFNQSEQLETRLWLFAEKKKAAGLLIQKMPGMNDELFWTHITTLADTIEAKELFTLSNETVLHRLFHEEDLRIFETEPVSFSCKCSREKIENALRQFGEVELNEMLKKDGSIKANCDFCNRPYEFDPVDIAMLFTDESSSHNSPETPQ